MNKVLEFFKSFIGIIIYFAVNIFFSSIIKVIDKNNQPLFILVLCLSEIVLLLILILVFRKRIKKDFKDFDKNYKKYLSYGIKIWFIGLLVMGLSNSIIYRFISEPVNQQTNELIISLYPLYSIISIIICGPFVEEIVFRLSFKEHIKNKHIFLILTTLIFAGIHIVPSMTSPIELLYFIPYGALALSFGIILQKTDNIFTTVLIHTFHNTMAILLITITTMLGV